MYGSRNVCASDEASGDISLLHLRTGKVFRDFKPVRIVWEHLARGMNLSVALEATAKILGEDYWVLADELHDSFADMRIYHLLVLTEGNDHRERHGTAKALFEWVVWRTETSWLRRLRLERALAAPAFLADQLADAPGGSSDGAEAWARARTEPSSSHRAVSLMGFTLVAMAGCMSGAVAWTFLRRRPAR